MEAQTLHDLIILPTLLYMDQSMPKTSHYNSIDARILCLSTGAVESNCGEHITQIGGGPALAWTQMEPKTCRDIWDNCDALKIPEFADKIKALRFGRGTEEALMYSPQYACAMMRLKYAMDTESLPPFDTKYYQYIYWSRIYNTHPQSVKGFNKFKSAWYGNGLDKVLL